MSTGSKLTANAVSKEAPPTASPNPALTASGDTCDTRPFRLEDLAPLLQERILKLLVVAPLLRLHAQYSDDEDKPVVLLDGEYQYLNLNICKTSWKFRAWGVRLFWRDNTFDIPATVHPISCAESWLIATVPAWSETGEPYDVERHAAKTENHSINVTTMSRANAVRRVKLTPLEILGKSAGRVETKWSLGRHYWGPRVSDRQKWMEYSIAEYFDTLDLLETQHASFQNGSHPHQPLEYLELDFSGLDPSVHISRARRDKMEEFFPTHLRDIELGLRELSNSSDWYNAVGQIRVSGCPVGTRGTQLVEAFRKHETYPLASPSRLQYTDDQGTLLYRNGGEMFRVGTTDVFPVRIKLMKLPKELRLEVIKHNLFWDEHFWDAGGTEEGRDFTRKDEDLDNYPPTNVGIIRTCKDLYDQGLKYILRNSEFMFEGNEFKQWAYHRVFHPSETHNMRRIDLIQKLILGFHRFPLELGAEKPWQLSTPRSIDVSLLDNIRLSVLEVYLTDKLTILALAIISKLKSSWLRPSSGRYTRLAWQVSYDGIEGVDSEDEVVTVFTMHQPDHPGAEGLPVKKLVFKASKTWEESEETGLGSDGFPNPSPASRIDWLLRRAFLDDTGNTLVCRKCPKLPPVGRDFKTTLHKKQIRPYLLKPTPRAWCIDAKTNESCICETGDVVAHFKWHYMAHNGRPDESETYDPSDVKKVVDDDEEVAGAEGDAVDDEEAEDEDGEALDDEEAADENGEAMENDEEAADEDGEFRVDDDEFADEVSEE